QGSQNPKYPRYSLKEQRQATFLMWPRHAFEDVEALVEAGLFYEDCPSDLDVCLSVTSRHWEAREILNVCLSASLFAVFSIPILNLEKRNSMSRMAKTACSENVVSLGGSKNRWSTPLVSVHAVYQAETKSTSEPAKNSCAVCLDEQKTVLFLPCQHLVTCVNCGTRVQECPMCRAEISQRIRAFLC
ncbi:unnamed protein product, partial [Ixodes hexagonus]